MEINEIETAYLMRLNALILDVINGSISEDTIAELKALQPRLGQIIRTGKTTATKMAIQKRYKKSPCNRRPNQYKS